MAGPGAQALLGDGKLTDRTVLGNVENGEVLVHRADKDLLGIWVGTLSKKKKKKNDLQIDSNVI
jgi:hypothetical protein